MQFRSFALLLVISQAAWTQPVGDTSATSAYADLEAASLMEIINDPSTTVGERIAAEKALTDRNEARMLPEVFAAVVEPVQMIVTGMYRIEEEGTTYDPTYTRVMFSTDFGGIIGSNPGTGSAEMDATLLPVGAQIMYSRLRVWKHLVRHAQPDEERQRVLVQLFDEACTNWIDRQQWSWELGLVLDAFYPLPSNWSEQAEQRIVDLFNSSTNGRAVETTARLLFRHTHMKHFDRILDRAWSERHTPLGESLSLMFGPGGRFDVRIVLMHLDRIDRIQRKGLAPDADPALHAEEMHSALAALARYYDLDDDFGRKAFAPDPERGLEPYSIEWLQACNETGLEWIEEHRDDMAAGRFKPEWAEDEKSDDR